MYCFCLLVCFSFSGTNLSGEDLAPVQKSVVSVGESVKFLPDGPSPMENNPENYSTYLIMFVLFDIKIVKVKEAMNKCFVDCF